MNAWRSKMNDLNATKWWDIIYIRVKTLDWFSSLLLCTFARKFVKCWVRSEQLAFCVFLEQWCLSFVWFWINLWTTWQFALAMIETLEIWQYVLTIVYDPCLRISLKWSFESNKAQVWDDWSLRPCQQMQACMHVSQVYKWHEQDKSRGAKDEVIRRTDEHSRSDQATNQSLCTGRGLTCTINVMIRWLVWMTVTRSFKFNLICFILSFCALQSWSASVREN